MGYIKSRQNGSIIGTYCDVCGQDYVDVIPNPTAKEQDICANCYNRFFNGGVEKDKCIIDALAQIKQIALLLCNNPELSEIFLKLDELENKLKKCLKLDSE